MRDCKDELAGKVRRGEGLSYIFDSWGSGLDHGRGIIH